MIEEPPLLTIRRPARRPTDAQIAAFQGVMTGWVIDAMYGEGALDAAIGPVGEGRDIDCFAAGPALTAESGPADILATTTALAFVRPGDVVVAAFDAYQGCAAAGDLLLNRAKNAGAAGFVTDGPLRDYSGIVAVGLPAWCSGLTPASPYSNGPGKIGLPVSIGGQRVETGDMIVADRDGVVVVPFDRIDEVIAGIARVKEAEAAFEAKVKDGLVTPEGIERLLASDKVRFVD